MSAINPASFASPSLGLQAPSGVGPGAVGANRQSQVDRRQHQHQQEQPSFNNLVQTGRGYQSGTGGALHTSLDRPNVSPTSLQQPFAYGYSAFATGPRNGSGNYGANMLQQIDPFTAFSPTTDYQGIPGRFPSSHAVGHGPGPGDYGRQGNENDGWLNSFQGLSLNSR